MHEDFRYEGIMDGTTGQPIAKPSVTPKVALGATGNVAAQVMTASALAYRCEQRPVSEWKDALAAIEDESLRAETRRLLEMRYRAAQHRRRVAEQGKKTDVGDSEMAKLKALAARL